MYRKGKLAIAGVLLPFLVAVAWQPPAAPSHQEQREALTKAFKAGNYKDAYTGLRKLALDAKDDPLKVGEDLDLAVTCLQKLGRLDEADAFREAVIAIHKGNWRLLETAGRSYARVEPYGYLVAGNFYRGYRRAGGQFVSSAQRDRVRALQLLQQALPLTKGEVDKAGLGRFHLLFANVLLHGDGGYEAWRLQALTNLDKLPDFEPGYYRWRGRSERGAAVDAQGVPVFHSVPASYEAARSDGERWRWMLTRAAEVDPSRLNETEIIFANFLRGQFGVQTMASVAPAPSEGDAKTGTYALHTLGEDETIARLATGLKRFKLPVKQNWITIYRRVADRGKSDWGKQARDTLSRIFADRRQYPKAADAWRLAIREYGPGEHNFRQQSLDQIVSNWGRFEGGRPQAAGQGATVDFRYRNGNKVSFEAHAINVPKLLADARAYLTNRRGQLDYNQYNISDIGYRLVARQEKQYIGAKVASWDVDLKPRPQHFDQRITVTTPLRKPGAYLIEGKMAGGNVSRIIVWVSDTAIVRKQLDQKVLYYVADAVTGQPVAGANVDLFGWKQVQVTPNTNDYKVESQSFTATTNEDGQLVFDNTKMPAHYQWVVTATKSRPADKGGDRFAYLGFTYAWYNRIYDPEYNATRVFAITDRPVYRPEQTVQFKFWVRHAKYDQADTSDFAGRIFTVRIVSPRGDKVYEKSLTADAYGGLTGELALPKGAQLGIYSVRVVEPKECRGGNTFRVEEYKKPEYEVTVEAPKEPVRLGDKVTATVKAKYYFGAPVTRAKVKVKVLRTTASNSWYPNGSWDWFYGPGYWWFAADYNWFPGWRNWGVERPVAMRAWGRWAPEVQPEVVLENDVEIGSDGTVQVTIDSKTAKELHPNQDHQYTITAEVTDESRRTIVGTGKVLVARKPFRVFTWTDRGHYLAGDTIEAGVRAQTLAGQPVQGKGELTLFAVSYNAKNEPVENVAQTWALDTNDRGQGSLKIKAAKAGQYRISYKLTDAKKNTIEGGYVFLVRGAGFVGQNYRFNDLELVTDKREYAPGEKVKLLINTDRNNGTVLLFVRPTNGVYLQPKTVRLKGKSVQEEIGVIQKDMPNFFVEALTITNGRVHTEVREVVVPPEKRVLNVAVEPSQQEYKPGQQATVKVKVTDFFGKPFVGSTVLTVYDKSVEYISGGSNVGEIRAFFWKWRRHHSPTGENSLAHWFGELLRVGEVRMSDLGAFGASVADDGFLQAKMAQAEGQNGAPGAPGMGGGGFGGRDGARRGAEQAKGKGNDKPGEGAPPGGPEPTVRRNFVDTAFWTASLTTDKEGKAEVSFKMPDSLTAWKVRVWALGHGTKVGQGEVEVTTKKDLLVRLQAPRFFVEKDEVVLSANVHNYLKGEKSVRVSLELKGSTLALLGPSQHTVRIAANGEKRIDWRVKAQTEGTAIVCVKAVTDDDSDAVEMQFPVYVHGMLKFESFTGVIRPTSKAPGVVTFKVPAERRIAESRLEVRYSPTLAGAMVDALPYLVEYPYGCTEQTLNRFLPTVITQRVLQRMKLDLKAIEKKRTNLNSGEIGDDKERAKGWKRFPRNPVFDEAEVVRMSAAGVQALAGMQLSDGGWGWFSGFGERSGPHTTAVVVHGLQLAKENDIALPPGMLERGVDWLRTYQANQLNRLLNAPGKVQPWKPYADNLDALVYMVLLDGGVKSNEMRDFLYRDRTHLAVYAKAMFGLALHKEGGQAAKLAMILQNIEQFVEQDGANQTAYLRLPAGNAWWNWYGSETEANAYYLKLLAKTNPRDEKAAGLVKYLLNNRKHATYWNSTRDTAICVEAMADFLKASGEDNPDMTVSVWLNGKKLKEERITRENLFTFDNKVVLTGDAIKTGGSTLEIKRTGTGPVYYNAFLSNFTLEDFITKAGLEVRVNRKYYKLTRVESTVKTTGGRGQVIEQKVEKYERKELKNLATLKSGELVEVELEIDSRNDYEYLVFEDPKAAGFEPLAVRSGYVFTGLPAYMEVRDEKVCFFVRRLARGKHSVSYRMRAEVPGRFSALPTQASAMYAPELRGNSDEIKLAIVD